MNGRNIPKSVTARLPVYLHFLKSLKTSENRTISSSTIARALGLGEVQVRKDLALVSGTGRPKIGYYLSELIPSLEETLGSGNPTNAVIAGAGKLGRALLSYDGFAEYGLNVMAAFDKDGECPCDEGKLIYPICGLKDYCIKNNVKIGIITVPEKEAQDVCDLFVESGADAIWNFAPVRLEVPATVSVKNENMAASLAVLSAGLSV